MKKITTVWEIARYIWDHWHRFPYRLTLLITGMLTCIGFELLFPYVASGLIDSVTEKPDAQALGQGMSKAVWAVLFFTGNALCYHMFRYLSLYLWMGFAADCMRNIVSETFQRVQRYSTEWHNNNFAGATVRKISRGMWAYDDIADTVYMGLFPAVCVLLGVSVSLFIHWSLMGIFVFVGIIFYLFLTYFVATRWVAPANRIQNDADSEIGAVLADVITCNNVVKAFGAEHREDARFKGHTDQWRNSAVRAWTRMQNLDGLQMVILLLMQGSILLLAVRLWSQGLATPGDVTFVMTNSFLINAYLREVGQHMQNLQKGVNELEDVVAFSKLVSEVPDKKNAVDLSVTRGSLTFEQVDFTYKNQATPIYQGLGIDIGSGEKIALAGRSGSGKSTLIKLLMRFYDLNGGRILIDGQDIATVTQESLRQAVALVPQEPVLFHRSLAENIAYGNPNASMSDIRLAAQQAHANEFIEKLPEGYDTLVGERGVKLSGGERQRIAIARAFLADAPILILDEATSSLDSTTERHIQQALEHLMQGRTTIIIAHRLSTVRSVDRVLVFSKGCIVEQGSFQQLISKKGGHLNKLGLSQTQIVPEAAVVD